MNKLQAFYQANWFQVFCEQEWLILDSQRVETGETEKHWGVDLTQLIIVDISETNNKQTHITLQYQQTQHITLQCQQTQHITLSMSTNIKLYYIIIAMSCTQYHALLLK